MFRLILKLSILFAIGTGLFAAISSITHETGSTYISPALTGPVEEWSWDMESVNLNCSSAFNRLRSIEIIDADVPYAGVTEMGTRRIRISKRQFESGTYRTKATVYHELGHFVFKLEHGSCRIMAEKCPSEEELQENWKQYVNEYLQLCINNSLEAK